MNYSRRVDNKNAFATQCFNKFTDAIGINAGDFADKVYDKYTVEDFFYSDDFNYFNILGYFNSTVIPHKIAVYQSGIEMLRNDFTINYVYKDEFIDRLIYHDISKFSAKESLAYAFHDFKDKKPDPLFEKAWHHHKMNNPHHPEYWLNPNREGVLEPINMDSLSIMEMIADWYGAGKIYGNPIQDWLKTNLDKFKWTDVTNQTVRDILKQLKLI